MTQETHKSLKLAFALKDRSRLCHETEQAAKLRRSKACDEAATETGRAREALRREYGTLVVAGASRLLEREIDPRTHEKLLEQLASEIARG